MENTPHVIAVPYPAQGHVIPMLELSQRLVKQGIKVTFVNTHFNHKRVESSSSLLSSSVSEDAVTMESIPDGLEAWEDRNELGKLSESIKRVMPVELEALINRNEGPKIVGVIADWTMVWALEVAERLGLRRAVFCPAAAATLALTFSIPKLVSDGIIDQKGTVPYYIFFYDILGISYIRMSILRHDFKKHYLTELTTYIVLCQTFHRFFTIQKTFLKTLIVLNFAYIKSWER